MVAIPSIFRAKQTEDPVGVVCWSGLSKAETEQLLDWLEANGYPPVEVSFEGDALTVRSRRLPAR